MSQCRITGGSTTHLFSLGELCVSDFIGIDNQQEPVKSELSLCFGHESRLLQLEYSLPASKLYGKYWYWSGVNTSMRNALQDVVRSVERQTRLHMNDVWLDIACNDGTLLSYVRSDVIKVGIDPAEDCFLDEAKKHADDVVQDFFSIEAYRRGKYGDRQASVVTVIAMFYDLDDPVGFLRDVDAVMDDEGLLVIQMSYTPLMIQQLAFDNICHEHVCYYSLTSLSYVLDRAGFYMIDCELNDVNGGSFRVYAKKKTCKQPYLSEPLADIARFRLQSLLRYEEQGDFNSPERYFTFYRNIQHLRDAVREFIQTEVSFGKSIWGYGASTKGNTLLQWFGLDSTLIQGIAERSFHKWGLRTMGTNIPIYSEEDMRKAKPDYLLILPWHFIQEFRQRESEYLRQGGAFIIPCPKFEVLRG